eukprot:COSAG01_NODE_12121_length_1798_cov_1.164214_1_plen_543_part_01
MRLGGASGLRAMEAQGEAARLAAAEAAQLRETAKARRSYGEKEPPPGLEPIERLRFRQKEKLRMRKRRALARLRAVIAFSGAAGLRSLCAPKLGDLVRTASEDHVQSPREMAIREKLNRRLSVSTNNSASGVPSPRPSEPRSAAEIQASLAARAAAPGRTVESPLNGRAAQLYAALFDRLDQHGICALEESRGCQFFRCCGCAEEGIAQRWSELCMAVGERSPSSSSRGIVWSVPRDRFLEYILAQEELDDAGDFVDGEQENLLLRVLEDPGVIVPALPLVMEDDNGFSVRQNDFAASSIRSKSSPVEFQSSPQRSEDSPFTSSWQSPNGTTGKIKAVPADAVSPSWQLLNKTGSVPAVVTTATNSWLEQTAVGGSVQRLNEHLAMLKLNERILQQAVAVEDPACPTLYDCGHPQPLPPAVALRLVQAELRGLIAGIRLAAAELAPSPSLQPRRQVQTQPRNPPPHTVSAVRFAVAARHSVDSHESNSHQPRKRVPQAPPSRGMLRTATPVTPKLKAAEYSRLQSRRMLREQAQAFMRHGVSH